MRISDWSSYVGSSDLAGAGALGKARHQLRDLSHAALVGAGDDRRDEPLVGGDGNGDVGRAETVDVIAVHLDIQLRHLHQRKRAGPDEIVVHAGPLSLNRRPQSKQPVRTYAAADSSEEHQYELQ